MARPLPTPTSLQRGESRMRCGAKQERAHGPWAMEYYVNDDGTFKETYEVERMWAENGITGDNHVVFYCGTAWRSSLAFYFAYLYAGLGPYQQLRQFLV